jgi:hypothetical protein
MARQIHFAARWERVLLLSMLSLMLGGAGPTTRPAGRGGMSQPMPTTLPAATAVEAVQGYLRAIRAGHPEAAVTAYLDSYGMLDLVSGTDAKLTGEPREEAAADIRLMIESTWETPGLAQMMRTSELVIKSTKPSAADGLTQVDYVLTVTQPKRVELPNTMYLRKAKDGWRIVDMNQANQPRMSEAMRTGYLGARKADPSATLEKFLFDVMRSARRKMQAATQQSAATRPGGPTTRPVGR